MVDVISVCLLDFSAVLCVTITPVNMIDPSGLHPILGVIALVALGGLMLVGLGGCSSGSSNKNVEPATSSTSTWIQTEEKTTTGGTTQSTTKKPSSNSTKNLERTLSNLYEVQRDLVSQAKSIDDKFKSDIEDFKRIYEENKDMYIKISEATGVPPELVAAIHYRESGGDFGTYLHNGDPLGAYTVNDPAGIYFGEDQFYEAAVDALNSDPYYNNMKKMLGLTSDSTDIAAMTAFGEVYNGLGYYREGKISAYTFSGTNLYTKGKYTSDGKYDPNFVDKQPGTYILIKAIM